MEFPVWLSLGPVRLHPHLVFEILAYSGGFQLYRWLQKRQPVSFSPFQRLALLAGCILGAVLGAKGLGWLQTPFDPLTGAILPPGKTIVGGLLGGWLGIEMVKIGLQIRQRTGDVYLLPMALGLSLGRVGCFLTGLSDGTHGNPSVLPWAVDFGDGIPRHPTQAYESLFVLIWGLALYLGLLRVQSPGSRFRLFMAGYLLFRFASEWLKPVMMIYGGLSAIAWASLLGAVYCLISVWRLERLER